MASYRSSPQYKTPSWYEREAFKMRPDRDVFKVTVLGLAKAGKTALCSQAVNHFFPEVYHHTRQTDSFITRVEVQQQDGESLPVLWFTPRKGKLKVTDRPSERRVRVGREVG
jgi:GTPase SAR1 family protein